MGLSRDALRAGIKPKTMPIKEEQAMAASIDVYKRQVHDSCNADNAAGHALKKLSDQLVENAIEVILAANAFDSQALILSDPLMQAVLLDWNLGCRVHEHNAPESILTTLRCV